MNTEEIVKINYKFTRNILARAVLRNSSLFYEKYISEGYPSFINSLKGAWVNTSKSFGKNISIHDVDLNLEIAHVYENGDFVLIVSLPYCDEGCDMIGFYIRENNVSMDFSEEIDNFYDVDISYYIFYKTSHMDKYTILEIGEDMSVTCNGYVSASESILLKKLYKKENKKVAW